MTGYAWIQAWPTAVIQLVLENIMSMTGNENQREPSAPLPEDGENGGVDSEPMQEPERVSSPSPNTTTVPRIKNN